MKIGIIVATDQEIEETRKILKNFVSEKIFGLEFFTGNILNKDVILVKCGIGKVNAGRTAQIMIDKFEPNYIVNIGAAGAINPELNIKDIVIGNKLVQYDFDISSLGDAEKGEISGIGKYLESDKKLVDVCKDVLENKMQRYFNYKIGTIATADVFCSDKKQAEQIRKEFNAECVEMEGAAIAQVCYLDSIPFLVIRGISDSPNGNNGIDYYSYCNIAARQSANILENILKEL